MDFINSYKSFTGLMIFITCVMIVIAAVLILRFLTLTIL